MNEMYKELWPQHVVRFKMLFSDTWSTFLKVVLSGLWPKIRRLKLLIRVKGGKMDEMWKKLRPQHVVRLKMLFSSTWSTFLKVVLSGLWPKIRRLKLLIRVKGCKMDEM